MWRLPTWKDLAGLALVVLLIGGLLAAFVGMPGFQNLNRSGVNSAFGPEWHCAYSGKGDPVCVKKSATQ